MNDPDFDAVLLIAFGGPNALPDVRPFLDNVLRGRAVPADRVAAVIHHYEQIGGGSPLNDWTFRQAHALAVVLRAGGPALPVYVGMRNWTPYLHEALAQMAAAGVRHAVGVIMSAQQSDAGWRRYQQDVATAQAQVGAAAPQVDYVSEWHAHPLFIDAVCDRARTAIASVPSERRAAAHLIFTAHSIPVAMADASPYVAQIRAGAERVVARLGQAQWSIAYQSRSGDPQEPWLEPDVCGVIRDRARAGVRDVVVVPIGFVCDHVEVLYDLDIEAQQVARAAGVHCVRAATVNDHPQFIQMLADVVRARVGG